MLVRQSRLFVAAAPRRFVFYHHHHHSLLRFYSTPLPTPNTNDPHNDPHINPAQRKQKLDLRPAPMKPTKLPSTLSATHTPTKPTVPLTHPKQQSTSLGAAKEKVNHDLQDAEAHGILAPPPPDASWARRTLHKAIEIAKFYFRGVKLIFIRRKEIKFIRARIKAGGTPLTRAEHRLIRTQKSDINKVIPFLFIALLLEEIIPLIAIYAPFLLPSTCILPSQQTRIEEQRTEKAIVHLTQYRELLSQLKLKESPAGHLSLDALKETGTATALSAILRLSTLGFDALRIYRIRNHLEFVAADDQLLLLQEKLQLTQRDLEEALRERGMIIHGLTPKAMESQLKWWLDSVGDSTSITRRIYLLVNRL